MSYENIQAEAARAIKGKRRPKDKSPPPAPTPQHPVVLTELDIARLCGGGR